MINKIKTCQHGIEYDGWTEHCYYVGCKYERRFRNPQCSNCQIHSHANWEYSMIRQYYCKYTLTVYKQICDLEYQIQVQNIDLNYLKELIEDANNLIKNVQFIEKMPECLTFKILQISQLLQKLQSPILRDCIEEFQQFIINQEEKTLQFNLVKNTDKRQITKIFNFTYQSSNFIALSPNEKYIIVGTSKYVYLYDASTKINLKIYKFVDHLYLGQFSISSRQIILICYKGIIILDILTSKIKQKKSKIQGNILYMQIIRNYLFIIQKENFNKQSYSRFMQFDLKSNHLIFSYKLSEIIREVDLLNDLISFQSQQNYFIINSLTRKTLLKIDFKQYQIQKPIILKPNEMLSLQNNGFLIIWNIDYQDNRLIKLKSIPLNGTDIFQGNPQYSFFYLILNETIFIIDEKKKYGYIYCDQLLNRIDEKIKQSKQLNSDKIFLVFSKDWICLLEIKNTG